MSVKISGHTVNVIRNYFGDEWHFSHTEQNLGLVVNGSTLHHITRGGLSFHMADEKGTVFSAETEQHVFLEEYGYLWEDKWGSWIKYDPSGKMLNYGDKNGVKVFALNDPSDKEIRPERP